MNNCATIIENERILQSDLGVSTAPPGSPSGIPRPATHDFLLYAPADTNGKDTTNQHIQVIRLSDSVFFATWTRGCLEGGDNQHIVVSRSEDRGRSWCPPLYIDGPEKDGHIASWSFPIFVPRFNRIYLFYNKQMGFVDFHHQWTGQIWFRFSEDGGKNWSTAFKHLRIEPNNYSNRLRSTDPNWIVFQPPITLRDGHIITGFTHIGDQGRAMRAESVADNWSSECRFMRFDNITTEDDPEKLVMTTMPSGGRPGLRLPDPNNPDKSFLQEPSIAELPDGRLFCVMRTMTGFIAYSVSTDGGESWTHPATLRYAYGERAMHNPVVPCPIYRISGNRYLLIFYNNPGDANQGRSPLDWCRNRRPAWFSVGQPCNGQQPLTFGQPVILVDNDRIPISRKQLTEVATYPSVIEHDGQVYLFFTDRKHYVLGALLKESLLTQSK